jgi:hypothetical protein
VKAEIDGKLKVIGRFEFHLLVPQKTKNKKLRKHWFKYQARLADRGLFYLKGTGCLPSPRDFPSRDAAGSLFGRMIL